jgi:NADPH:quinone reductase-like Zn-dependent oxidoreductase
MDPSGPIAQCPVPKILRIEATGVVQEASNGEFEKGQIVMTAMGGMVLFFDGGYTAYNFVPSNQVQAITTPTKLGWNVLGALPEMLQVSYGCVHLPLEAKHGDRVLTRGGTTSIGLTGIALAKSLGAHVTATSRRTDRESMLRKYGVDEFLLKDGDLAVQLAAKKSIQKFNKILEMVELPLCKMI